MSSAPVTAASLLKMKRQGEKIAALTCYDASFTQVLEAAGVEVLLVGDSLGMVLQGHESTLSVRLEDMIYHGAAVARGARFALRIVDMPFMSYGSNSLIVCMLAIAMLARIQYENRRGEPDGGEPWLRG